VARCLFVLCLLILAFSVSACRTARPAPSAAAPGEEMPARFEGVTSRSGIRFRHFTGADGRFLMPEHVGSGGGFIDYDGDGWLDIFLVNCTGWPDRPAAGSFPALYRNQRDGTFRDVTREAGLAMPLYGMGCAVGDFDNDGRDDLFVTCVGPNRLFRNLGNGKFRDVTQGSGLGKASRWAWHTSAAWVDYDRDSLLDLFICRYVKWSPETDVVCRSGSGKRTYCGPNQYPPQSSLLYRGLGNGKFQDVSAATGIAGSAGKALGVLPIDENEDGWTDLLVTHDTVPNVLFRSNEGRRFEEVGQEIGVAVDDTGKARAGMGVDAADVGNDGGLAFGIGNFSGEGLSLYTRDDTLFSDTAGPQGLVPASLQRVTFGVVFLDADGDGWQDFFTCNGHINPHVAETGEPVTYRQTPQFFHNERGRFREMTAAAGAALQEPQVGRGCAWGDFDNDGRPDLLLCENGGPTRLLRNTTPHARHWLGVRLRGRAGNQNGYGAEVRVTAGGMSQRRWIRSGSSYLSHSDTRGLFGLGKQQSVARLEVRWLSGRVTVREQVPVDTYLEIQEPE
jgi:enediyne biosynthesis protein E4